MGRHPFEAQAFTLGSRHQKPSRPLSELVGHFWQVGVPESGQQVRLMRETLDLLRVALVKLFKRHHLVSKRIVGTVDKPKGTLADPLKDLVASVP